MKVWKGSKKLLKESLRKEGRKEEQRREEQMNERQFEGTGRTNIFEGDKFKFFDRLKE